MAHVDAYLIPVRRNLREAYTSVPARVAAVCREQVALHTVDRWMDEEARRREVFHADGARGALDEASEAARDFGTAAGTGANEVVVLWWTEWPDKAAWDTGLARALDPRLHPGDGDEVRFEGRSLISGGFAVVLNA